VVKQSYGEVSKELLQIEKVVGNYFTAFQKANYGQCIGLSSKREMLHIIMLNAYLAAYAGCIAKFQGQKGFDAKTTCHSVKQQVMEHMISIEEKMTNILSKCNRDHAIEWTQTYIGQQVNSGTATARKNQIKTFLDKHYPNFYYAIVVQQKSHRESEVSGADIDMTSADNKFRFGVSIATVRSHCDSSEIYRTTKRPGIGIKLSDWYVKNAGMSELLAENFENYRLNHQVTMVAVHKSGTYAYKGLRPCTGSVSYRYLYDEKCGYSGHCTNYYKSKKVYYFALNQWKCHVASNKLPSGPCRIQT